TCSPSGAWSTAVACLTTESCKTNACVPCAAGTTNCDSNPSDCETNLDALTSCGTTCANKVSCAPQNVAAAACTSGACGYTTCSAGFGDCDGNKANGCEATLNTPTSCGTTCANKVNCAPQHVAAATCANGACGYTTCSSSFNDCDGNKANGCEASFSS